MGSLGESFVVVTDNWLWMLLALVAGVVVGWITRRNHVDARPTGDLG